MGRWWLVVSCVACLGVVGCQRSPASGSRGSETVPDPIKVVCTTGIVADLVERVGGDHVDVTGLMGPGVDPHLYKASPSDVRQFNQANIIFYNGLHLEGRLTDLLVQLARRKPTFAVTEGLVELGDARLREPPEFEGFYDPHVWHDVSLWETCLEDVARRLETFDPAHADYYRKRAATARSEFRALHEECLRRLEEIPAEQRVLVTAHDAFGYFGEAYDVEVHGLQGISTVDEPDVQTMESLVDLLVDKQIKAVFVESSVPPRGVEALIEACSARGHTVNNGGQLYSDALGRPGTSAETYVGMMRHNVSTIVEALR